MGTITRNFANNIVTGGKVDGTDGLTGTIPASNVNNDTLSNLTAFPATVGDFVETTASECQQVRVQQVNCSITLHQVH